MILRESETPEKVLEHLDANVFSIKGKMEWVIAKARVLLRLERYEESIKGYERLLQVNPENYSFHRGWMYCFLRRKPTDETVNTKRALDSEYVGTQLPLSLEKDFTSEEREKIRDVYVDVVRLSPVKTNRIHRTRTQVRNKDERTISESTSCENY